MEPVLSLSGVVAGYRSLEVLRGVDLTLFDGEIVTVLGPNGAGKTTLMRAIAGQIGTMRGTMTLGGSPLKRRGGPEARVRAGLAMVPEGRGIFPRLTVRENLLLGAHSRGWRRGTFAELEAVQARFPALAERQHSPAGLLSGGQQQMLAIARSLLASPRVLLLDEPSLGLAPKVIDDVLALVRDLPRRGVSVILVEQNVSKALAISDRAYVLRNGLVERSGPAAELAADQADISRAYMGTR